VRLLDAKRHNALSIQLAKLPELSVLAHAIRTLDEKVITGEVLEALCKILPTAEETKTVCDSSVVR